MIKFNNFNEEVDFIDAINELKDLILIFKNNHNNQEFSDDLDTLFNKVDDLLKFL